MKNYMHRFFSLVLVLAMLLSVLPTAAFATAPTQIKEAVNEPIVNDGGTSFAARTGGPRRDSATYYKIDSAADFGSDTYIFITDAAEDDETYTHYALLNSSDGNGIAGMLSSPATFTSTPQVITAGSGLAWTVTYSDGSLTIQDSSGNYLADTTDSTGYGLELSTTAHTWTASEDAEDQFVFTSENGNVLSLRTDLTTLGSNDHPIFCTASSASKGSCYFHVYRANCPHTYAYSCNYDGTHTRYCTSGCGYNESFDCSMSSGTCSTCGYTGDHTVTFSVPDGVDPIDPIVCSQITLPVPTGTPSVNPNNATFVGWVVSAVDNSSTAPTIYYTNKNYYIPGDVSLHALYSYAESSTYTLYDGSTALAVGDKAIIVARDFDYAMSRTQNNNNRASEAITKSDNTITVSSTDNVAEFAIGYGVNGSSEATQYSLNDGSGYLASASSSKNLLHTEAALDANSTWAFSIDSTTYAVTLTAQGEYTRNTIRYNASNNPPLFACYAADNASLREIQLYLLTSQTGVIYTTEFEAACEHIFTYASNGDGTHTATCGDCGYSEESDCNLTDGACPDCGYTDVVEYTVSFVVPEGVNAIDPIVASEIVLPTPSGTPAHDYNNATFIGWTDAPISNSEVAPTIFNTSTSYALSEDLTLYALYSYTSGGNASVFTLYDGSSDISVGDKAIIVAKDYDFALSTTQNSNNRAAAAIVKNGNTISLTSADSVQILTIGYGVNGSSEPTVISFATESGYLTSASSSGNYLRTSETLNENSSWAYVLDTTTNELALTAQGSYTRNTMRYNKSSTIFACYVAENSQYGVQLYIQTSAGSGTTIYTTEFSADDCLHEFEYSANGDGTHSVECLICGYTGTEDCNLADGPCPECGYEEECLHDEMTFTTNDDGTHNFACVNCDYSGVEDCNLADGPCPDCGYEEACLHELTYTTNDDGTHNFACANCDYSGVEDCDLSTGTCPECGYAEIAEYTVTFVVPAGVDAVEPIVGSEATFPVPTGTPNNNYYNAVFIGWTTQTVQDSVNAPDYYKTNTSYAIESDMTLYALYAYTGAGATFTLYDGSEPLSADTQAIIVAKDYDYAISTTQNTNNRAPAEITKSADNTISLASNSTVAVFTIGWGINGSANTTQISLKDDQGYLRAASSSGNYLRVGSTVDENSTWLYAVDSADSSITLTAQGSYTRNTIRYNKSSNLFACYAADNANQMAVQLYVASGSTAKTYTTVFSETCPHTSTTTTTEEASCVASGYTEETCDLCGEILSSSVIEAFGHDYVASVTAPTCVDQGYTTYTCLGCNDSYISDYVSVGEHDYIAEVTTQATCTSEGVITFTCSACGDSYTEIVASGGHTYNEGVVTTPATCTADGVMTYTCTGCNASYTETIAAIDHDYTATVIEPTCGDRGYTNYKCLNCGDRYEADYTDPTGEHDYVASVVDATCATQGYTKYTCLVCDHTYESDYVEATGEHDYVASVVDATCATQGYTKYTCLVCDHTYESDYVEATGEHDYIATVVAATCTAQGYTKYTCLVCNYSYEADYIEATGEHDYIATVTAPTCSSVGFTTYSCQLCGNSYMEDYVPSVGHAYTYTDNGDTHTIGCKTCNYSVVEDHAWNDGEVATQPSCGVDGVTVYTCTTCSAQKTEVIPSVDHAAVFVAASDATCTENGAMAHYKCSNCGKIFLDAACTYELPSDYVTVAPTGHSYVYNNAGTATHTITCANGCDYNVSEAHSYTDGACICGAAENATPEYAPEPSLKFTMNISVGVEMMVTYNIMGADVNSYKDFYLEVKKDVAGGEAVTTIYGLTSDREPMTAKVNPTTGEALMYQVTYKGINAKEMGDNFSTTLYAVAENGTIYYGNTTVNSIKNFLIGKIDAAASSAELKTMAVDMLKYGAAAQIRLNYNTENLVTADLTAAQLAYATQEIPSATDNSNAIGDGKILNMAITVGARVQLNLSCVYSPTDESAMRFVVIDSSEGTVISELPVTVNGGVFCKGVFDDVGAKEMRRVITIILYEGDTPVSKMTNWSVESYVAQTRAKTNVAEDELNMVNAMLTYGDSVAAYMKTLR